MFSLKDTLRKVIVSATLAALTTSFFTGCSKTPQVSSSDLYTPSITNEVTPPGITDTDTSSFSIKYKYWYDSQEAAAEEPTGTLTGKNFLGLSSMPIYTDTEENEYIMSGRTQVYLADGKINVPTAQLLRTEQGDKVYAVPDPETTQTQVKEFANYLASNNLTQATSLEERQTKDEASTEDKDTIGTTPLYVNNLKTDFTTKDGMISIADIFSSVNNLGTIAVDHTNGKSLAEVTMNTAAGYVTVTLDFANAEVIDVSYSTNLDGTTLTKSDAVLNSDSVSLTPDTLERILGYDVEVYADLVNVVTDNHDLFSTSPVLAESETVKVIDPALNAIDHSKPMTKSPNKDILDTQKKMKEEAEKIRDEQEENTPKPSTPEQQEEIKDDRDKRQEAADDTAAYTTEGIPLTTDGDLTAPAKPTANYKLPPNAQLTFSGDASTALITKLPEGCYWSPTPAYPNAYMDPAGNRWCNQKSSRKSDNTGEGYYDPQGHYHFSQDEIDSAIALNAEIDERHNSDAPGVLGDDLSTEEAKELDDLLNSLL